MSSSSKSAPTVSSDSKENSNSESLHSSSPMGQCSSVKIQQKMGKDFQLLECDENYHGAFCKVCREPGNADSETHIRYVEVELLATKGMTIAHYLCVGDHKRSKTEKVISSRYVLISYANNTSHTRQTSIS